MPRKLLHAIVAIATFMVVWLVASPASATPNRAPVCDPRGAIGFAPPPQIQDTEQSLDIPADCVEVNVFDSKYVGQGRGAPPDLTSSTEPVSAVPPLLLDLVFAERLPAALVIEARPPPGVRASLDRPPRG
jgi:hypothetical protein